MKKKLGIIFIILAVVSPLFGFLVPYLGLSKAWSATLVGFFAVGAPEIFLLLGGLIAGKELIDTFKKSVSKQIKGANMLKNLLKFSIVAIILGYLFSIVISILSPEVLLPQTMQELGLNHPQAPSKSMLYTIVGLNAIPIMIVIYGFVSLFQYINDTQKIEKLKLFGFTLISFALLRVIIEVLGTYLLVKDLPVGEREASVSFGTPEGLLILFGLLILYIAKEHLNGKN